MRKILLTLFAIALLFGTACNHAINHYNAAVAIVYGGFSPNQLQAGCTATAFQRTSTGFLFVSAAHCVSNLPDGDFHLYLGDDTPTGTRYAVTVLAEGDQAKLFDFSVLEIHAPQNAFTIMPFGHNPKNLGERIYAISSPEGIGREYLEGAVSILDIQSTIDASDGEGLPHSWQHNIGFQMLGEGPGSSGSTIACADQNGKICLILIGHIPGTMVAEPIERFEQWWKDVQSGKIARIAPKIVKPSAVDPLILLIPGIE